VDLLHLGLFVLCISVFFDVIVRLRMSRIGRKWVFLVGGFFDYREYLRVRSQYGWAAWPIYVIWVTAIVGIALILLHAVRTS